VKQLLPDGQDFATFVPQASRVLADIAMAGGRDGLADEACEFVDGPLSEFLYRLERGADVVVNDDDFVHHRTLV
jgi:hypothetical protein